MTYDEMTAWLNRYRNARQIEPRLREQLREDERRAAYVDILRKASPGGAAGQTKHPRCGLVRAGGVLLMAPISLARH